MPDETIQIDRQGPVATLWLNRPEVRNAFDAALIARLDEALQRLDASADVGVVVLAGRGKAFCAGGDLAWMRGIAAMSDAENLADAGALAALLQRLANLSKPTVARVHGPALAGGTGLVAACDIAVASTDAFFGTTEVRLGLLPATISPYVIAAIGARAARRYFLTGERIDAQEARRLGLVHELCPPEALDATVAELVAQLLLGAPAARGACKRLVADYAGRPLTPELVADSAARLAQVRGSDEAREGLAAFFGKRTPRWVG
jgi:methylglutaconyl-CoA hydratase